MGNLLWVTRRAKGCRNKLEHFTNALDLCSHQVEPTAEACKAFMQDLSVRKIPGVGVSNDNRNKTLADSLTTRLAELRSAGSRL